ncbi:hypothetical protein [Anaerobranca gottschalkii]|uniref:Uncharacterized protein n=1 Tax=Anaerobranca gottschalkii DSM 13577 TaxID=1120990 RepID=A0A1I0AXQ1_9FIRM|nr:hypothetical protein [Anaerobranca gottschalkii]SES99007.1 hypothetical protein SAMN03080614_102818 [Anaerobranca gottschalkii DSM 13577]
MIIIIFAYLMFIFLSFKVTIFRGTTKLESRLLPEGSDITIGEMSFSPERIVYYISLSKQIKEDELDKNLHVEYVSKGIFDTVPLAIQVYLNQGQNKKLVAELLEQRFDLPALDSLLGENKISKEQYEYIKKYKFKHPSTKNLLLFEVKKRLKETNFNNYIN